MGPPHEASSLDAQTNLLIPGHSLLAFPSPAISDISLDSPSLIRSTYPPDPWTPRSALLDNSIVAPEADPAKAPSIMTPGDEQSHGRADSTQDMNLLVGGVLAPVQQKSAPEPAEKAGRGLRLPSFESLGIAAPHAHPGPIAGGSVDSVLSETGRSRVSQMVTRLNAEQLPATRMLTPMMKTRALDLHLTPSRLISQIPTSPTLQFLHTLTPPAESSEPLYDKRIGDFCSSPVREAEEVGLEEQPPPITTMSPGSTTSPSARDASGPQHWAAAAAAETVHNIHQSPERSDMKVLVHALPAPSTTGNAFPVVIEKVQEATAATATVFINVTYAVPGRMSLEHMPTSPPATPRFSDEGDYFGKKIFDTAVPVVDYSLPSTPIPRSPRPVVPPSTVDVSVVERYIPPPNEREFEKLFDTAGPSLLVDRLTELGPHGSLIFIYPTAEGAKTFNDDYLCPIIDPILTTTAMIYGWPMDFGRTIAKTTVANKLPNFNQFKQQVQSLCERLGEHANSMTSFYRSPPKFRVVYADKKEVKLQRAAWAADWFPKQEKALVVELINKAVQNAAHRNTPSFHNRPPTATEVWQKFFKDVETRPYEIEPQKGVEVGVFVIQRLA